MYNGSFFTLHCVSLCNRCVTMEKGLDASSPHDVAYDAVVMSLPCMSPNQSPFALAHFKRSATRWRDAAFSVRATFFIRRAHKSGAGSSLARPAWQAYARPLSGAAVPGRPWPGTTPLSLPVPWLPGVFFSGTTDCPGGVPGWAGWRDKGSGTGFV